MLPNSVAPQGNSAFLSEIDCKEMKISSNKSNDEIGDDPVLESN
jgi:hypothetical protein